MIRRIRQARFLQLFWGGMAVFLLNLSVDAPDPFPSFLPEDLTHNEQESITELIVEQLLGFDNAFVEYDDDDNEERNSKLTLKLDVVLPSASLPDRLLLRTRYERSPYPPYLRWPYPRYGEVAAPPPRS